MPQDDIQLIRCANCHSAVVSAPNPQPQDREVCPYCGESDTLENAIAEARDHLRLQIAKHVRQALGKAPPKTVQERSARLVCLSQNSQH